MDAMNSQEDIGESQQVDVALETPPSASAIFTPPSVVTDTILSGASYAHYCPIPAKLCTNDAPRCVLGIDEAGRGPVLGPMVYAAYYLPTELHRSLLADTHHFDDSKVLTPETRSRLMQAICTPATDLHDSCGWAAKLLSARDISADMLAPVPYNLNAQALDATVEIIQGVLDRGVNIEQIYVDTVGQPEAYQKKLQRVFPGVLITVAKKADSLYPVVSAASVVAKVTRDAALEVCWEHYASYMQQQSQAGAVPDQAWGSGYPSDPRTMSWLKANMDPIFGWGYETRFSWGPAKDGLEGKAAPLRVEWPLEEDENGMRMTDFFTGQHEQGGNTLANWFGTRVTEEIF